MKIEWVKLDGHLTAIDKETGEILNEALDTLPDNYNVQDSVKRVLEDMFGDSLITTSLLDKPKTGPKPKQVSNPYASFFSDVYYNEDTGSSNMIAALDDLVYSASTASTGNTRIPVKQLVYVMKGEDLSTKAIQSALGKRRIIKGEKEPGKRYCQQILESAEHLIRRIETHQERGVINMNTSSVFQFEADSAAYERSLGASKAILCPVEFTDGDKHSLRALARAGNIEAINDYLQRITEQSGRMMQRILGDPVSEDSKEVYMQLQAEFPYSPYDDDFSFTTKTQRVKKDSVSQLDNGGRNSWMFEVIRYLQ